MLQLTFICVSNFGFMFLPTGPYETRPILTTFAISRLDQILYECKSSLQPSINILRKSKKIMGNFSHYFFSGNHAFNRVKVVCQSVVCQLVNFDVNSFQLFLQIVYLQERVPSSNEQIYYPLQKISELSRKISSDV